MSTYQSWFMPFLEPYVYFVPVEPGWADVVQRVQEAVADDALHARIAEDGRNFARVQFTDECVREVWVAVLRRLSRHQGCSDASLSCPADCSRVPFTPARQRAPGRHAGDQFPDRKSFRNSVPRATQ